MYIYRATSNIFFSIAFLSIIHGKYLFVCRIVLLMYFVASNIIIVLSLVRNLKCLMSKVSSQNNTLDYEWMPFNLNFSSINEDIYVECFYKSVHLARMIFYRFVPRSKTALPKLASTSSVRLYL